MAGGGIDLKNRRRGKELSEKSITISIIRCLTYTNDQILERSSGGSLLKIVNSVRGAWEVFSPVASQAPWVGADMIQTAEFLASENLLRCTSLSLFDALAMFVTTSSCSWFWFATPLMGASNCEIWDLECVENCLALVCYGIPWRHLFSYGWYEGGRGFVHEVTL